MLTIFLVVPAGARQDRNAALQSVLEDFASRIEVFGANEFLHGFRSSSPAVADFAKFLSEGSRTASEYRQLLKNSSPKVRTLAFESAWSPGGIDFFMKDAPQGLKSYPKETGALFDRMAQWRRLIREHKPN